MNNRCGQRHGFGDVGHRHHPRLSTEASEIGSGVGLDRCPRTDTGSAHGVGFDGVPRGGGRGHCHGGGHFAAGEVNDRTDAPLRRFVGELVRKVETLEKRLEGEAAGRGLSPTPDTP